MKNHLKEILEKENRVSFGDNRNRAVRNLNMIIELGVTVNICENGYTWTSKSGFSYNLIFKYKGISTKHFVKNGLMSAYNVLTLAGRFLKKDEIKELIKQHIETPVPCGKCAGKGIIPQFMYYAEGVCFDCAGTGLTFK